MGPSGDTGQLSLAIIHGPVKDGWLPRAPAARRRMLIVTWFDLEGACDLLYADRHILVVDKPAGLLTIPSAAGLGDREDTVLGRAREYARQKQGRRAYIGMLHRLDRGTSGALAIALSREAHEGGRALFRAHRFERRYLALVHGVPRQESGTITARISSEYRDGRRAAVGPRQPGQHAVTHYMVVEALSSCALVELTLETGRQHQIRIHLADLGHPGTRRHGVRRPSAPARGSPSRDAACVDAGISAPRDGRARQRHCAGPARLRANPRTGFDAVTRIAEPSRRAAMRGSPRTGPVNSVALY